MTQFVDQSEIIVESGKGGSGAVSFRREKYIPRGGPDGGNGGRGGDVVLRADSGLRTLLKFRYKHIFKASNGEQGRKRNQNGRDGQTLIINVPVGTVAYDDDTDTKICDLAEPGQSHTVVKGGRGGKGNAHFKTSTHQTPRFAQPGEESQRKVLKLELKLLADVGLIGLPNAGKSTLISVISAAKPKIADYPFTTLTPNLGIVENENQQSFIVADIPGLIEGSYQGKGLGDQFLRHIERSAALIFLVDVSKMSNYEPEEATNILFNEIDMYDSELTNRLKAIVATKIDLGVNSIKLEKLKKIAEEKNVDFFAISAVQQKGIGSLIQFLFHTLKGNRN